MSLIAWTSMNMMSNLCFTANLNLFVLVVDPTIRTLTCLVRSLENMPPSLMIFLDIFFDKISLFIAVGQNVIPWKGFIIISMPMVTPVPYYSRKPYILPYYMSYFYWHFRTNRTSTCCTIYILPYNTRIFYRFFFSSQRG